jgi:cell wall-associated NlpC family hydrolase
LSITAVLNAPIALKLAALLVLLVLTGCGSRALQEADTAQWRSQVVASAQAQLGTPYRYGGSDSRGFDCSGLVYYAHRQAGVHIPRTAAGQLTRTRPVSRAALRPGDVVFFRTDAKRTHTGIYIGEGRFIHAPSTGKTVSYDRLDDSYWKQRFLGGGRFI